MLKAIARPCRPNCAISHPNKLPNNKDTIMTFVEYVTVAISALAIVTRIVFFIRNPSVTTPAELWIVDHPQLKELG
jgi:hypothetical protein